MNKAIKYSKGEYIARMDGDDVSMPLRFEKQIAHLNSTNSDICGCHYHIIDSNGSLITKIDVPLLHNEIVMCLGVVVPFAHPSVMIKKAFLDRNNLYYGKGGDYVAEDLALWHQLAQKKAKFTNVDECLFKYRQHEKTLTTNKRKENIIESKRLTKNYIINNYNIDLSTVHNCSDRTQMLIIRSMIKALVYKLDFSYFKNIHKFRKKALVLGTLTSIFGKDLLF